MLTEIIINEKKGKMDISKVKEIIESERVKVPVRNHKNYDAVCRSYLDEVVRCPGSYSILMAELWCRIQDFRTRDRSMIPPLLFRKKNESPEMYIERIYNAGGYIDPA